MDNIIYNSGKVIIFPLTQDEISLFCNSKNQFSQHINLNVFCCLEDVAEGDEIWVIVKISERAIVGYAKKNADIVKFFVEQQYGDLVDSAKLLFCQYEEEYHIKLDYK